MYQHHSIQVTHYVETNRGARIMDTMHPAQHQRVTEFTNQEIDKSCICYASMDIVFERQVDNDGTPVSQLRPH